MTIGNRSHKTNTHFRGCKNAACLVDTLHRKGIPRGVILDAFRYIPRDHFVPEDQRPYSWEDRPLPIGEGQTISQPYTVAYMLELAGVSAGNRVCEVGTGSGYVAALLTYVVGEQRLVTTIEINEHLFEYAKERLHLAGLDGINTICGNGRSETLPGAPFDVVLVAAQAAEIPETLTDQLSPGGRLVMPVDVGGYSIMTKVIRTPQGLEVSRHDAFQFVPLL